MSSPHLRAAQTVEPIARRIGVPVGTDRELREWDSGLTPRPDCAEHYAASRSEPELARPGGESLSGLTARSGLRAAARPDGPGAIGNHGTFVSSALAGFGFAVDWPFSRDMPVPAVYRVRFLADAVDAVDVDGPALPERTTPLAASSSRT